MAALVASLPDSITHIPKCVSHLIRLGNVGENGVNHAHKHPVLEGVSCVLDDGNHVGARLGHVDEVSPGPVSKLHRVNTPRRPYDVRHMRYGRTGRCTEVKHLWQRKMLKRKDGCPSMTALSQRP